MNDATKIEFLLKDNRYDITKGIVKLTNNDIDLILKHENENITFHDVGIIDLFGEDEDYNNAPKTSEDPSIISYLMLEDNQIRIRSTIYNIDIVLGISSFYICILYTGYEPALIFKPLCSSIIILFPLFWGFHILIFYKLHGIEVLRNLSHY